MSNDSRNDCPKIWNIIYFGHKCYSDNLISSLIADKEHSNTCRVFSAWNNANYFVYESRSRGGARKFDRRYHQFLLARSQRRQWAMGSISASIPSNYVLRISKTSVAAGTFTGHELFVVRKVSPTLGDNYIDVINHCPLRATLASYSVVIFHQTPRAQFWIIR